MARRGVCKLATEWQTYAKQADQADDVAAQLIEMTGTTCVREGEKREAVVYW